MQTIAFVWPYSWRFWSCDACFLDEFCPLTRFRTRMTCIHGSWKSWDHPIIATFTSIASTPKATSDASTRGFCSLTALVKIIVTLLLKLSASCNFCFFHNLANFHVTEKSGYDGQKNHCVYLKYSEFALHLLFTLCWVLFCLNFQLWFLLLRFLKIFGFFEKRRRNLIPRKCVLSIAFFFQSSCQLRSPTV